MRPEICLCPWAAAALLLLLATSPNLSMAFSAQHMHSLRSSSHARLFQNAHFSRGLCCAAHDNIPRRKGMRRTRGSMLHTERQGVSSSSASRVQQSSPLRTAIDRALPFGRCVGVELPVALTAEAVRTAKEELMPEEMSYGLGLPPPLQLTFLGGRLAIRRALGGVTEAASAILHNQHGAPVLPDGVSASISHKRHMAVALVQSGCEGHVGVDIELPAVRRRVDLRRRVLTPRECGNLGLVSGVTEQEEVLLRFSMKEAVYKAAHPFLRRPLGFKDVEVQPRTGGGCEVRTSTAGAWGDLKLSAGWIHLPDVLGQPLFLTYCKAVDGTASCGTGRRR